MTTTPASIGNGTTTADYIGRSLFYSDHYFKGRIRDFRVYNRALPATEVQSVAAADWEEVQALATYNNALDAFEDPTIGPVVIFPSDYTGDMDHLQPPPDWTDSEGNTPASWPTPTIARSDLFTADQISVLDGRRDRGAPG
ncbi:LamG-like jellyroll fold domain-containing protein, partial [Streptomyces sp. NPDC005921]